MGLHSTVIMPVRQEHWGDITRPSPGLVALLRVPRHSLAPRVGEVQSIRRVQHDVEHRRSPSRAAAPRTELPRSSAHCERPCRSRTTPPAIGARFGSRYSSRLQFEGSRLYRASGAICAARETFSHQARPNSPCMRRPSRDCPRRPPARSRSLRVSILASRPLPACWSGQRLTSIKVGTGMHLCNEPFSSRNGVGVLVL